MHKLISRTGNNRHSLGIGSDNQQPALMVSLPLPASRSRIRCCEDTLGRRSPCFAPPPQAAESLFPDRSQAALCPRPRRIILVRHGQSEGNVDESAYTRIPDPRIGLTAKGWRDAEGCGLRIRDLIAGDDADDWKVYFYVSPYRRTLETLRGLAKPFERSRIAGVREEPRLREQDFGAFSLFTTPSCYSNSLIYFAQFILKCFS